MSDCNTGVFLVTENVIIEFSLSLSLFCDNVILLLLVFLLLLIDHRCEKLIVASFFFSQEKELRMWSL